MNRIAFISGAAGHLGREMAFALGETGATLILNGRTADRLAAFARELKTADIKSEIAAFDMMDVAQVRAFFAGRARIDVLINNAVTMTPKAFDQVTPDDFTATYASAVTAAFEAARAARPSLARAADDTGDAAIVNIATMYALSAPDSRLYNAPGQMSPPHYGAAKAGLVQLTRHLAGEFGRDRIRVNALCLGPFPRPEVAAHDPAFAERLASRTMLGRTARADEIRGPVVFLSSPASSFVTGSVLVADGGWTAW